MSRGTIDNHQLYNIIRITKIVIYKRQLFIIVIIIIIVLQLVTM